MSTACWAADSSTSSLSEPWLPFSARTQSAFFADESLQFCALERTRQDFALREAAQGHRVADGSAKFYTDLECLQVGRIVEDVCMSIGSRGSAPVRRSRPRLAVRNTAVVSDQLFGGGATLAACGLA